MPSRRSIKTSFARSPPISRRPPTVPPYSGFTMRPNTPPPSRFSMPSPAADLLGAGPLTNTGLGLGSNLGDKAGNIARARLEERGIIRLAAVSSIYRTAPWGYVEQDFFANACAVGETRLPPLELLAATNAVETEMGRQPSVRWGPRLIDIDILFHGDASFV